MPEPSKPELDLVLDRLLRRPEVEAITGLSCSTIYRLMDGGGFPRPRKIGAGPTGAVAWRLRDIERWIENLAVADPKESAMGRKIDVQLNDRCRHRQAG